MGIEGRGGGGGEQLVQIMGRSESHGYGLPVGQNQKVAQNTGQFFNEKHENLYEWHNFTYKQGKNCKGDVRSVHYLDNFDKSGFLRC